MEQNRSPSAPGDAHLTAQRAFLTAEHNGPAQVHLPTRRTTVGMTRNRGQ